jgi:hypothetical protein
MIIIGSRIGIDGRVSGPANAGPALRLTTARKAASLTMSDCTRPPLMMWCDRPPQCTVHHVSAPRRQYSARRRGAEGSAAWSVGLLEWWSIGDRRPEPATCFPPTLRYSITQPTHRLQYAFAHTTRCVLGLPVNGQVPGTWVSGSSPLNGMTLIVTCRSWDICSSTAGSPHQ